jgi:hypothetical protein
MVRMMNGKDLEGSGCGLNRDIVQAFNQKD